ncbi:HAD-IA family hydrolase [Paenibacillus sp. GCM10012303]|uniref:HAD-IA family hydrolase n=1 Tax=Paenibacillus sp. GCM10012303 TaxID=3317340 RepID=UPI0036217EED
MIQAFLFDMDGVIIDSNSVAYELLSEAARSYDCSITADEIKSWGSLSSRQFWSIVKERYNLPHDLSTLIGSYNQDREIELYASMQPVPGVLPFLLECKEHGMKTALATSASRKRMDAVLDLFGLRDLFDVTVCDEEVAASKPDPQIFLLASDKLQINPRECIVIEDSRNGWLAAKQAGMKCLGFKGLSHVDEDMTGADLQFHQFQELSVEGLVRRFSLDFVPLDREGLALLEAWFQDPEVRSWLGGILPLDRWYRFVQQSSDYYAWNVYENGSAVGHIHIETYADRTASVGLLVHPAMRFRGYGARLLQYLLDRPELMGIETVKAYVETENRASLRCFQKAGFIEEGLDPDGLVVFTYPFPAGN